MFRHLWGIDEPWEISFPLIRAEGFVGIESPLPPPEKAEQFLSLLNANQFEYIAMAFTGGDSVDAHVKSLRAQLDRAIALNAIKLTAHSGHDFWRPAEAESFFREAVAIAKSSPIPIGHETHRGRILFNPWISRDLLEKFDGLELACDYSHWVCVAERLLPGCDDILRLCADRCVHLHSRVGYEQGPQVPDPSAPEYRSHLETHEKWWEMIWKSQELRGVSVSTVTPEFGPPAYLHTLPHTNAPVADLRKICKWMADRVNQKFNER